MTGWVKLENETPEALDRKTMERNLPPLSDKAFRLWFNAICFCSRAQTDGHVPAERLMTLTISASKRVVDELCAAGLLDKGEGRSYIVHDYLEHNLSRARIRELRDQGRKRVEKHRGNAVTNDAGNDKETLLPPARERERSVSLSLPDPLLTEEQGGGDSARDENALPTHFPVELIGHLDAVQSVLGDLAVRHGARAVSRLSVASTIAARPRKPLVRAARDYASWADSKGQKRRDVVAGYRNWLDRTDDLASVESLGSTAAGRSGAETYAQTRARRSQASREALGAFFNATKDAS